MSIIDGIANAVEKIGDAVDKNVTSKEEMLEKVNEARKTVIEAQNKVRLAEANGNWLQRSWRPISAFSLLTVVLYTMFIAPMFSLPSAELTPDFWDLVQVVMGGYVFGRTIEKTAKTVETVIRKKKRKNEAN